jgi:TfoX/Sxy family transcriptional regulator of competence genes
MATQWRKSPAELVELFSAEVPSEPDVERRQMFGYPCAFLGGNMFMGLHQENFILRLGDADRAEFLKLPGAAVFQPMPGRTMREYVVVPPALKRDRARLARWVKRALAGARALPPKSAGRVSARAAQAAKVSRAGKVVKVPQAGKAATRPAASSARKGRKKETRSRG